MMAGSRPGVTVVIPAYGDPDSLDRCIRSALMHTAIEQDRILVINDCGPEVDEIERVALDAIAGHANASYFRNEVNLGFVKTCNRAALELDESGNDILLLNSDAETTPGFVDELSRVLHASAWHGIVCPRSNNATIASLPFRLLDPSTQRTPERTAQVHEALVGELPEFAVSPVAMGFCFMVRRSLIDEFGLFDEVFSPGYGEENDFCLRMNRHGYLSIIANRAVVYHLGSRSFSRKRRAALRAAHEELLVARHPYYTQAIQAYLSRFISPIDVFADVIAAQPHTTRLLLHADSLARIDPVLAHRFIEAAAAVCRDSTLTVDIVGSEFAQRRGAAGGITYRDEVPADRIFDMGVFALDHVRGSEASLLNRTCARWGAFALSPPTTWSELALRADFADVDQILAAVDAVIAGGPQTALGVSSWVRKAGASIAPVFTTSDPPAALALFVEAAERPVDPVRLRSRWSAFRPEPPLHMAAASAEPPRRRRLLRRR
ncbi:hypothetical protein BH09ACT4_BH09ACT4_01360 [soil metagenome]